MRTILAAVFSLTLLGGQAPTASLPVTTVRIDTAKGHADFVVEVAADDATRERGLMFRKKMAANAGMLFDFHQPVMPTFWMKDTILPLDMVFIRADGTVSSIAADAVPFSLTSIPSGEPVRAVLEINAGRAKALDIKQGDKVHAKIFDGGR